MNHSSSWRPKWTYIPDEVGKEYYEGASLLELGIKYGTSQQSLKLKLASLQIPTRKGNAGMALREGKSPLTPDVVAWVLEQDLANAPHYDIARLVGVSRERIRQICLAAGHATRRSRMTRAQEIKETRLARKAVKMEFIRQLSEMYKAGESYKVLHLFARPKAKNPSSGVGASVISAYRRQYPDLFPYRRPLHWNRKHGTPNATEAAKIDGKLV